MHVTGQVADWFKSAANFYASRLMDGRVHRHIYLEIEENPFMSFAGLCVSDEDRRKPKIFTMRINPCCEFHPLQIIAHEMVHIKQHAMGELYDMLDGNLVWKGELHRHLGNETDAYREYPWEVEAHAMEVVLFQEYLNFMNGV